MIQELQLLGQRGMKYRLSGYFQNLLEKSFLGQCQKNHFMNSELINVKSLCSNPTKLSIQCLKLLSFLPIALNIRLPWFNESSRSMYFSSSEISYKFFSLWDYEFSNYIPLTFAKSSIISLPIILNAGKVKWWKGWLDFWLI